MLKKLALLALMTSVMVGSSYGQTRFFGQNKVQYKNFKWQYIQTRHFDIYFTDKMYETAKPAAAILESSYVVVTDQLDYRVHHRIPVFIYNSPNDFQQTNIVPDLLPEGVGGFTEAFKNRIAVPYSGSFEDFRHVLHHELTHAVIYDMLFGNAFASIVSRQRLFDLPLWFAEGFAEYSSRYGWDYFADMVVRDATINNYLQDPEYIGGYLAYKEGQALINYIVDNYGEQKLEQILSSGKMQLTMNKALKSSTSITTKELFEGFSKEMKRRYWPEIARRKEPGEIAKALTKHEKDGSGFNGKPIFSPKGDRLAIFTDRKDYIEVFLISAINGKIIDRLVKAERSGDLESLHSYLSGITFSPDGEKIAFVAKVDGKDALYFLTIEDKNIYAKKYFRYNSILAPVWSPDGTKIAFSALDGRRRDIVIYDLETDKTVNIMNDNYDDVEPSWFPDSKMIAFSSDRPHPDNDFILKNPDYLPQDSVDFRTIYNRFGYGNYSLFKLDAQSGEVTPIKCGPGINREPVVSADGRKICFVSNRNGIDNLYVTYLDSSTVFAITDVLTGVASPSWSPDGHQIAFSSFNKAGFDVFLLKDWKPVGDNGNLAPTDFVTGKYKKEIKHNIASDTAAVAVSEMPDSLTQEIIPSATDSTMAGQDTTSAEHTMSDSTRIENGDYVFVSPHVGDSADAVDGLFEEMPMDSTHFGRGPSKAEAAAFDSIADAGKLADGEYKVRDYRVKFTPDYVSGGFSYDNFFGLNAQSYFVYSDYLGDHQIYFITDLVNTIDQSSFMLFYLYNRMRVNFGLGLFHSKNYYLDNNDFLFSDRFYGIQGYASRPFSQFSRIEALVSQYFIDRRYHDYGDTRIPTSSRVATAALSLVHDNIIWGVTGPLNGKRSRLDLDGALDFGSGSNISFYAAELDYRKYWHIKNLYSFAVRLSGGYSWGDTPRRYFLGGNTNQIGSTDIPAKVYDVENLYFSEIITPLRGYDYYAFSGDRYFLANLEFRYPFVDYLKMNFPLPLTIGYITGNWFADIGSAWDKTSGFKGGTSEGKDHLVDIKTSFGFGIRANLGIFVLRYDLAWSTDFADVAAHPMHYFSLGADF